MVCFSPEHSGSFGTQTRTRARTVIEAWADRTAALSALPGVEQVFPFENRGEAIGVTLAHPHGQIYAYPYITPRTTRLLASIDREGRRPVRPHPRVRAGAPSACILRGEHWTAFVPFAARWPLEVHLMPHRHVARLRRDDRTPSATSSPRCTCACCAASTRSTTRPLPTSPRGIRRPCTSAATPCACTCSSPRPRRAADKLKFLAGSEAAMGAWIGDVPPETAAARLREAVVGGDAMPRTAPALCCTR